MNYALKKQQRRMLFMKTKIIQKILAIMVSTATIISTPGLASAAKPKNSMLGKKTSRPSNSKNNKNDKNNNENKNDLANKNNNNDEQKIPNIQPENNLNSNIQLPYTETEKKDFFNIIENINAKNSLNPTSEEEIMKIINLFKKFVINNNTHANIANAIFKMAVGGNLKNLSKDNVLQITSLLCICSKSENARKFVAATIFELNNYDLFNKYSEKEICDLIYILNECSNSENAGVYVANSIFGLADRNILQKYPKEKMTKITNLMIKLIDYGQAAKEAMRSIAELAKKGLLDQYSKYEIFKITASTISCSKKNNIEEFDSIVISELAKKNLLKGFSKTEILNITDMLLNCIYDNSNLIHSAEAIAELAKNDLLQKLPKEKILEIINVLSQNAKKPISQKYFSDCIYGLAKNNLLNQISKVEFLQIMNIISKISSNTPIYIRESAAYAIAELMHKNLFAKYYSGNYSEILEFVTQNCDYYPFPPNKTVDAHVAGFAYAIKMLARANVLTYLKKEFMMQITDLLIVLSYDIKASKEVVGAFNIITDENLLQSYNKSKLLDITYALRRCVSNDANMTIEIAKIIKNFALKNLRFDSSESSTSYLVATLGLCDYSEPNARYAIVETIRALNFTKLLNQLPKSEFRKLIKTMYKLADVDQEYKIYFAKIIKEFAQADLMCQLNLDEIQKIIDSLRAYANEIKNNKHIDGAIDELNNLIKWKQYCHFEVKI